MHVVKPPAAMLQKVLSPRVMSAAFEAGLPWPSPQQLVAPDVVTPHAETYCPLT